MLIQVIDGQVKLATHKINVTIDSHNENLMKSLVSYQQDDFGLVAYSVEEKDAILSVLSSFNTTNTVENLSYSVDVISKAQGEKYNSRTEALNDLLKIVNRTLNDIKNDKISDLNTSCNNTILAGFTSSALSSTLHTYPFESHDQINMSGALALLNSDTTITSITWKTLDAGNLPHTRDQFSKVCKDSFIFKQTMINKYWNLKAQVETALDEPSVNAIVW
jgi:hypothetical protein